MRDLDERLKEEQEAARRAFERFESHRGLQQITDQASDEEIEAREQYDIERYLDEY